jgi:adenylate cyclase
MIVSAILTIAFPLITAKVSYKIEAVILVLACLFASAVATLLFMYWRIDVPLSEPLAILLPAACVSLVIRGASVELQAAHTRRALERYLPPELLDKSLSRGLSPDLSTRRQELTIVFTDMRGFSTLSESVEVEYISSFLKDFFEGMTRTILKHRGRIHQFLGDGFLAVFGDFFPLENSADAALRSAVDMQREMNSLNAKWASSGIKEFERGISIRIGVNTGLVFVGDLGSDRRLEYAVVGSAVNIAARLQALAPPGGIMMTSRTKALLRDSDLCQGPEVVRLKGIDRDMEVYTIQPGSF